MFNHGIGGLTYGLKTAGITVLAGLDNDNSCEYASLLCNDYFAEVLGCQGIDLSNNTVAIYMGGEPSIVGEGGLRSYIRIVSNILPKARHTIVTNLFNLPKWLVAMSLNEFSGQIETTYANGKKQTLYGNEYKYQEKFVKHLTLVTEAGINWYYYSGQYLGTLILLQNSHYKVMRRIHLLTF
jgi:hypothetical protein